MSSRDFTPRSLAGDAWHDLQTFAMLGSEWQKRVVDQANHFVLFQPVYQIAVRNTVKDFPLTAAGWMLDLHGVTPAG